MFVTIGTILCGGNKDASNILELAFLVRGPFETEEAAQEQIDMSTDKVIKYTVQALLKP